MYNGHSTWSSEVTRWVRRGDSMRGGGSLALAEAVRVLPLLLRTRVRVSLLLLRSSALLKTDGDELREPDLLVSTPSRNCAAVSYAELAWMYMRRQSLRPEATSVNDMRKCITHARL
eukprot:6188543-Pleurochrysis_carterae.AAC.2